MPRKPRIEYAGAVYHVMNRGNYRADLFSLETTGASFEETLFHACSRFGWRLFAYVLMSNHYHLALETRDANLVAGMQWLQSTFANRFNRIVRDRGHVFQGRYKALWIDHDASLLRVVNYIHLNPVRAGLETVETLKDYSLSSFPNFFRRKRPACLDPSDWLSTAGRLKPTPAGMRAYHQYLALAVEGDVAKRDALYRQLCRGWYIGTREGKNALLKDLERGSSDYRSESGRHGFGDDLAEVLLEKGLKRLGKTPEDLERDRKLMPWKVVLASWIKEQCGVTNRWFSETMHMGTIYNISRALTDERKQGNRRKGDWRKLKTTK